MWHKLFTTFSQVHDKRRRHSSETYAMKPFLAFVFGFLLLAPASARAASDADVTLIKAKKVIIEENVITIVAEATTRITLIRDNDDPAYKGPQWMGRPVTLVHVKSDTATFIIKRPPEAVLNEAWQASLKAAKALQNGKEVGRIGYYAPDIVIKGNLIDSISGKGFLY
jgi:hypothetical protein